MTRGPNGEQRHGDTVQKAMQVGRIATGQERNAPKPAHRAAGFARAASLTPEQRSAISRKGAQARKSNRPAA